MCFSTWSDSESGRDDLPFAPVYFPDEHIFERDRI
jgi:hypothetical protein